MNAKLTREQIEQYREEGFVVVHDFLSPEELGEWRAALDEALRVRGDLALPRTTDNPLNDAPRQDSPNDAAADFYQSVFIQRVNLWMDNPRMKELILDPRIGKMACDLEGIDAIRVWHDQTLIKAPWANPTAWHLDNPYWSFHDEHAISIWVALDDATLENGCLWFLPGTQKKRSWENSGIGHNMSELFKVHPEWTKLKAVPAPMKAGSCSFHNGITAHAAGPNMTPGFRRAMTCAFMPDGARFNGIQNVLPRETFKRLVVGDLLNDERQNPIVYQRDPAGVPA